MNTSLSFALAEISDAHAPSFNSVSTIRPEVTMSSSQVSLYPSKADYPVYKSITERPLAISTLVLECNGNGKPDSARSYQGRLAESICLSSQVIQAQNNQETVIHSTHKTSTFAPTKNLAKQEKVDSYSRVEHRSDEVEIWKRKYAELEQTAAHYAALYQAASEDITKLCDKLFIARQELMGYEALKIRFQQLEMELKPAVETRDRIQALLDEFEPQNSETNQKLDKLREIKFSFNFNQEEKETIKSQIISMNEPAKNFGDDLKLLEGQLCTSGYFMENLPSFVENVKEIERSYAENVNVLEGKMYFSVVINEKENHFQEAMPICNDLKQSILISSS